MNLRKQQELFYTRLTIKFVKSWSNAMQLTNPLTVGLVNQVVDSTLPLSLYYRRNDLIWQDGFLIDFLQKKMIDKWTRTFLVYSSYLFNERLVFDWVIRFFIELVIWSTYRVTIYEFTNVASTLLITLFLFLMLYFIIVMGFLGTILFF